MICVVIADDQAIIRDGLRMIIDAQEDMTVAAVAADGVEALALVREHTPDVVLMDIRMPRMDGLDATRRILARPEPQPRILVLTTFGEDHYVYEAMRSGASGFLLKDAERRHLIQAVRTVAAGDELIDQTITRRLIAELAARPQQSEGRPAELENLSARELDVMRLIARGLTNAEIAAELIVAQATIKSHVASLLRKLGARDRVQIVIRAYETGLIRQGH